MRPIGKCKGDRKPDRPSAVSIVNGELVSDAFWVGPVDRLLFHLNATAAGLTTSEAQSRLATYVSRAVVN
jgi:hypothetical protein